MCTCSFQVGTANVPGGPDGLQSAGTKHVALTAQNCTFQFTFLKQKVPSVKLSSWHWPMLASKCPSSHNALPKTAPRHFSQAEALQNYIFFACWIPTQPGTVQVAQKCNAQFTSSSTTTELQGDLEQLCLMIFF